MGSIGTPQPATEPIAIIGLACKFAGEARDAQGFWRLISEGRSAWSEIPENRFNARGVYHANPEKNGTMNVLGGHFIDEDLARFDAAFFSLSAEMAAALDPQFRLQLESVYEAIENAGLTLPQLAGSQTSVFAGITVQDYRDTLVRDGDNLPRNYAIGTGAAFAANRVSHFFDLRGESVTLDTGCSTTLVELHHAVHSLRSRESDLSIVGGSNLMLNPDTFNSMSSGNFLSKDGRSFAFDQRANGYGRGDGVATIIVKRLSDAIADRDPIRAIIRETALNQDGRTESITSPSQAAQTALMKECYRRARLDPCDTHYFEAHGTGTPTGDLIESGAMAALFKHGRALDRPLLLGSVKTNIGHAETTSGLAAIIKVVMAMEHGFIPPSINLQEKNRKIPFDDWRLRLVTEATPWPVRGGEPMRASINNFSYGGTNAHVIIESAQDWKPNNYRTLTQGEDDGASALLILSAKSEQGCKMMISNIKQYFEDKVDASDSRELLESVVYTLAQRRTLFPWVATQPIPLTLGLDGVNRVLSSTQIKPTRTTKQSRLGFTFTGQGAQWHAMGRELLAAYPAYRSILKTCDVLLQRFGAEWSLLEELSRNAKETNVNATNMSIPICVSVQIGLVELLRSWGIVPAAVTSHSSGEIAAAYTVGALDLRSAMAVAYHRAERTARHNDTQTVKGGMIAVGLGLEETEEYLNRLTCGGKAVAACINSPTSVTVAGDVAAVEEIEAMMKEDNVFARRLKVNAAYHSHHMDPIAEPYGSALMQEQLSGPGSEHIIAYSSPVTGDRITDVDTLRDPEHWVASMVQPVEFVEAFTDMVIGDGDTSGSSIDAIIEIGPHTALGSAMKDILALPAFNGVQIPYFGSLVRGTSATQSMQSLAGVLLAQGQQIRLEEVNFPKGSSHLNVVTDLPLYPWVHETRHWQENRLNRAFRERTQPSHDLLGVVAVWSNPISPMWRNILRINDNSWLRDHIVESDIVYPGAAYMCLAIEAMNQMLEDQQDHTAISGFHLREVDLEAALIVTEESDGVELQTILSPADDKALAYKAWKKFEIFSVNAAGEWKRHAQGMINAERESSLQESPTKLLGHVRQSEPEDFYGSLRRVGIKHGPAFQNIKSIRHSREYSQSRCDISAEGLDQTKTSPDVCIIQPAILDTIVQAAYTSLPRAGTQLDSAMVPRSIDSVWVSAKKPSGMHLEAYSNLIHADSQTFRASISTIDPADGSPIVKIDNLTFQSLGQSSAAIANTKPWEMEICNRVEWVLDSTLSPSLGQGSGKDHLSHASDPKETEMVQDLRRVSVYFGDDLIKAIPASTAPQLDWFMQKYYYWSQKQISLAESGQLGESSATWLQDSPEERATLIEKVRAASVNGEMVCHLGPHLASMVRGEQAPLELMMEERLLTKYYRNVLKWHRSFEDAAMLLRGIVQHNPQARILEIGGGTGGGTHYMLSSVGTSDEGGPRASAYHFTDISTGFFEAARNEFSPWGDLMQYSKLDIEQDPIPQGFEYGSYDVIVACQVLHATQSMRQTMSNVRKLLKPGGKLLLVETTQDQLDVQFVFGLLSGWWLSEEKERQDSPNLTVYLWDSILKETGFTGNDVEIPDCDDESSYATSAIMSTARSSHLDTLPAAQDCVIVTTRASPLPEPWLASLKSVMSASSSESTMDIPVYELESAPQEVYAGKICIFVGEAGGQAFLFNLNNEGLQGLKAMTGACQGLLWVTCGGAYDCQKPEQSLAPGFLRASRNEYVGRKLLTLDLDPNAEAWSNQSVTIIARILAAGFGGAATSTITDEETADFEYAERDGRIFVPRVFKDATRNKSVSPDTSQETALETVHLQQDSRPLRLQVRQPGMIETIAFGDDDRECCFARPIAKNMVKIEPKAYGLNFRDVMVAMGQLEERVMGLECAGTITDVGDDAANHGFAVGDTVMSLLEGPFASHVYVSWEKVMHIPKHMTVEDAASIPLVFTTAYYSLYEAARLKSGQSILIHAAAGGVGQAAIILAQHLGADIFATVGSDAKKQLLIKEYNIPEDRVFNSRSAAFVEEILAATNQRGVDVVLNSLAGPLLQASFDILAPFGHFVEIGKSDLERNSSLAMHTFARHVSFSSVDLLAMIHHRPTEIHRMLEAVSRLAAENVVKPVKPVTVYSAAEAAKAFRLLQTGKHIGKVVLSMDREAMVSVIPQRPQIRLLPEASYILVGGVGGLGISIARWMIQHGAKSLILLSRSAGKENASKAIEEQARNANCRITSISCDITKEESLQLALQECRSKGLPRIRGIVQGAMVLKDAILEQMTIRDYETAVQPKIAGTWNLHAAFPKAQDLDFFILLSSLVGILGNASQCNYAAAGAYQDALATWRQAQGLPCVSIDLATVKSVGYVEQNAGVQARMARLGHAWLDEDSVHEVLASAILTPTNAQIIAGINEGPGAHWDRNGSSQLGRDARFAALRYRQPRQQARSASSGDGADSLASRLADVTSAGEAQQLVLQALTQKLADVFLIAPDDIDTSKMPADYGVDSLVAVELRNMLTHKVGSEMSSIGIMQSASIAALAKEAATRSRHVPASCH